MSNTEDSSNVIAWNSVRPNQEWNPPSDKQLYKHKGRANSPEISIKRERNAVPKGEPFIWMTLEMLEFACVARSPTSREAGYRPRWRRTLATRRKRERQVAGDLR